MTARACITCGTGVQAACCSDFVDAAIVSSQAHRCMEQLCFAVGTCLLEPCSSLRPKPDTTALAGAREDCARVETQASPPALVCAFASVAGGKGLLYEAFDSALGARNCWEALERMGPAPYADLRVWEQIGWSAQPQHAIEEYERHAKALLFEASANQLL